MSPSGDSESEGEMGIKGINATRDQTCGLRQRCVDLGRSHRLLLVSRQRVISSTEVQKRLLTCKSSTEEPNLLVGRPGDLRPEY